MQSESLATGMVIAGKYVVERTLGRGGMGAVYVASHATTGKRMAMKVLLPEFVHNADLVGRFLREAQVMGRLQHRHVVDVFDVGRDGDILFIVMELLEGKPLSDLLHDATLTLEEALLVLVRAMEGVSAAHDHGVVHRDLKPDNIFVCVGASGRLDDPRVLDFGISKLDDGTAQQLTRSGVAMGTPYYMSIEQLSGQRDLDQRVDVYALGVILYEAISGTPPYVADSVSALAIRVITTQATHLGELRPDLPPGLAEVVMRAIARNRDDRYRSVRALIEALRPFIPRSAGLSVPEGQGRLLRTPRSGGAHRAATATEGGQYAPSALSFQSDVYAVTPRAPTPVATSAAPARASSFRTAALIGVGVVVAAGGAALFMRPETPGSELGPPVGVLPSSPPPAALPEPPTQPSPQQEPHASAPAPDPANAADAGSAAPRAAGADERSDSRADARKAVDEAERETAGARTRPGSGTGGSRDRAQGRKRSAAGASEKGTPVPERVDTAPVSEPATPAATPRKSAEGRAGKLGSDEF